MSRRSFARLVLALTLLALAAYPVGYLRSHITEAAPPDASASTWALARLEAAHRRAPATPPPPSAEAHRGSYVVSAWHQGLPLVREAYEGTTLAAAVTRFADEVLTQPAPSALPSEGDARLRFTVECVLGDGPLLPRLPFLETLSLVPMRDGLVAELDGRTAWLLPEQLLAERSYDRGPTPIPDMRVGVTLHALEEQLAGELGTYADDLHARGRVRRVRTHTIAEARYPDARPDEALLAEDELRRASVEGAAFLLRHQQPDGRWTYEYDARGLPRPPGYSLPRHAGTTYFVAQVDRLHGMPEARRGALSALRWIEEHALRRCGEYRCVSTTDRADVGSSALTLVAAAELHARSPARITERMLVELAGFLRAQQRPDGELMHEYDVAAQQPIDVQHMYYSGEAAFALLRAHDVLGDPADLDAARRLLGHLTGAGWSFLGSRYYYGEEHWTCIAAGEARGRVDSPEALDFCGRWLEWNDLLQYRAGETPWASAGAYGVGPLFLPRLTPVGSRTEAFINTYLMQRHHGLDTARTRRVIERGLAALLRFRWAPGPTHLFLSPEAALGGMPGSPAELLSRNDFVQHAGSAWIRWADVLREEREAVRTANR